MTAGWCSRTLRAAVFAAVCVLLAALGHVTMSGTTVPWWAMAAGSVTAGGTGWLLARRERGPVLVGSCVVAAQAVLHLSFSLAQALVPLRASGEATSLASMAHGTSATHSMGSMEHAGIVHSLHHGTGGMPWAGMLVAHLLAALLCGLWLALGERAAFRVLRACAARLVAPLLLILRPPTPPCRPRVRAERARSDRMPRRLLLAHALTSRGPPTGTAVA
ncbi:hypothetical protein F3K40_40575 [Streptomyces sp. LBUM 1478]|nr:hypothetical protein [Streptomyces scabiei]MBP5910397.1 hypothetical protein [Streptomyces sp. LBUM 1478]MDX2533060.1 hypothetical protein [Streptomyces scabiei]MDX2653445.1 hypothetical protein [Streptomyces scabiei]MDX2723215.1 hypothetical protein [Streptomyces scabiei]MDX2862710.1 hypothetical protein [Streptomyces scabiei]